MPHIPSILEMFKAGLHFGHQLSKRHPKMEKYLYGQKNNVHIINLEITQAKLKEALDFLTQTVSKGGTVLFLGTKKQAQKIVQKNAEKCGSPFITLRWLGGTFTNFEEISKLIKKYLDFTKKKESGELAKYTKKEQLEIDRDIAKLKGLVGGMSQMIKLPDAIFIVDLKRERNAVAEALKKNIPIVAVCDSNTNPENIAYPIPGNDDAVKSITMITELVAHAVEEGKKKAS
jgi:small subunit ribosomal protein S2